MKYSALTAQIIMVVFIITIFLLCNIISVIKTDWLVGRVPPSMFEYSNLNGWMLPSEAQSICEEDLQCGGFTFIGTRFLEQQERDVYFFHYIDMHDFKINGYKYSQWTTYLVCSRQFVVINGAIHSDEQDGHTETA